MDSNRIQPAGGNHAIEVMAIGVEWAAPIDEKQLASLQKLYHDSALIKAFLPKLAPVQAFIFQGNQFGV